MFKIIFFLALAVTVAKLLKPMITNRNKASQPSSGSMNSASRPDASFDVIRETTNSESFFVMGDGTDNDRTSL